MTKNNSKEEFCSQNHPISSFSSDCKNCRKMVQEVSEIYKEAMENMECYSTQNHLKECRKCAPVGNWKEIEEEFRKRFIIGTKKGLRVAMTQGAIKDFEMNKILKFFKPYFQEQMHKEAVEALEVVDNSNTDTNS